MYTEPNPYNPAGNLRPSDSATFSMDLTDRLLPRPRLTPVNGVIQVPAYTDFKLHDVCSGPGDPNAEAINQNQPTGSPGFFGGNQYFLSKRLWSVGSSPNHFHHGKFTTIRKSVMAHAGEAQSSQTLFANLDSYDQGSIIEFLKTFKVLPPGTRSLTVDEHNQPARSRPLASRQALTGNLPEQARDEFAQVVAPDRPGVRAFAGVELVLDPVLLQ
jgi:hypothetical protein